MDKMDINVEELCVTPNEPLALKYASLLKKLYDTSYSRDLKRFGVFSELSIHGTDVDTVWEEIHSRNRPINRFLKNKIYKLNGKFLMVHQTKFETNGNIVTSDDEQSSNAEEDVEEESDAEESESYSSDNEEAAMETDEENAEFDDMEAYLDKLDEWEDARLTAKDQKLKNDGHKGAVEDDGPEDLEEYFETELYNQEEKESFDESNGLMFSDFFVDDGKLNRKKRSKVGGGAQETVVSSTKPAKPTKLELKKRKLNSEIEELESELIKPKSWEYRGEVKGGDRPENSLLSVSADVERALKPAPLVTEEYTSTLESMIIQRIKDGAFNDPVPVSKKPTSVNDGEGEDLSQEKSQHGLGEIYANEFLLKTLEANTKKGSKDDNHDLVMGLFHKICRQLDALSHFHFTPKPVVSEVSVQGTDLPSLSMEEVAPSTHISAVSTMAPEEVHAKPQGRSSSLLSAEEMTSEDRHRLRRANKASRKKQLKNAEGDKPKREEEVNDRRVVQGKSNVNNADYTNSASFFSKLQDQVRGEVKKAGQPKKIAERTSVKSADNFKL